MLNPFPPAVKDANGHSAATVLIFIRTEKANAVKDYVEPTKPFDLHAHMVGAVHEIKHYTVIFVLRDKRVGSGVFVNTCGVEGILTAYHVAEPVLDNSEFGLCVAERPHALFVRSENCQHVPIGYVRNNPQAEDGPDLSFIIIRDANLLATLRSLKSFFYLDTKDLEYFQSPLERMSWCISGSPHEASKLLGIFPDGPLMMFQNFIGEATFHSRAVRGGFDFIKLKVPSGEGTFPKNCEGMSGGGMWLVPLSIDPNGDPKTIRHEAPLLAGVSFYQSEIKNGERIITGHGYDSIYSHVRQTLGKLQ
jgi:hypothetical protein